MAFDGITVANIVSDMQVLIGGRISKIAQPESDELILTLATSQGQKKLLISAGASLPLVYFTEKTKPAPMTAPGFCMLLRKHIGNARIISVTQPGLERIIRISAEHMDEMGDLAQKSLIIELMGKHSNIIFTDENDIIIDSIKRIPAHISSVREVLPGRKYFLPKELQKKNPLAESREDFISEILLDRPLAKTLVGTYSGISPVMAEEICHRAGADPDLPANIDKAENIWNAFEGLADHVRSGSFTPNIIYRNGEPIEFASIRLDIYKSCESVAARDASQMLESYYSEKEQRTRMRQKTADLRKQTDVILSRESKKLDLQLCQMKDTEKRDKYRLYGELLFAYAHELGSGIKQATVSDYNNGGSQVVIPLDERLSVRENAAKYYERYQKLSRTAAALRERIEISRREVEHLSEIRTWIDMAQTAQDIDEIKKELVSAGFIKNHPAKKEKQTKAGAGEPLHFVIDGFDVYVGKNNYQNEYVTFRLAEPEDWWFHAKGRPGAHVIVKTGGRELPDLIFEKAGALAAKYSSAGSKEKVDIDYTKRKNLKKPPGSRCGMVIYHTNFSLVAQA